MSARLTKDFQLIHLYLDDRAGCVPMSQNVLEVEKYRDDVSSYVYEAHQNEVLIKKYNIRELPCTVVLKNGELLGSVKGFQPLEILLIWLDSIIHS